MLIVIFESGGGFSGNGCVFAARSSGTSLGGTGVHAPGLQAPDFLAMAVKLGAVRSLQKPFKPRDIIAAVDQCLGGAGEKHTGTR